MKKLLASIGLFAFVTGMMSCQQHEKSLIKESQVDTTAIKASIDSLGGVVQKAHDTKDSKLLASTWAEDGILIMAGSPPVYGRKAIVTALDKMPPLPPGGQMKIHPIEIKVLGPEWAYVLGVDSLKYQALGAANETIETSTFFVLVRKTAEGWQTYRETLTPNQKMK